MIDLDLTDLFVRVHLELEEILWENVPGVGLQNTIQSLSAFEHSFNLPILWFIYILLMCISKVNANTTTNVDRNVPVTTFDAQTHAQMHADNKHNVEHATMEQFVHVQG